MFWTHGKKTSWTDPWRLSFKAIPCHPEVLYSSSLVAHLIIIVGLGVLADLVFLIVILVVLHLVGGDLGVVNDLAACASATLDDVALVDGVVEIVLCVILFIYSIGTERVSMEAIGGRSGACGHSDMGCLGDSGVHIPLSAWSHARKSA